jgi:hypothetical protein
MKRILGVKIMIIKFRKVNLRNRMSLVRKMMNVFLGIVKNKDVFLNRIRFVIYNKGCIVKKIYREILIIIVKIKDVRNLKRKKKNVKIILNVKMDFIVIIFKENVKNMVLV